ncbi:MAG: hypothetical protein IAE96_10505 [Chitinophagaceae bacterium]|nr:hypothetical protein [Chitinophagaceae bacterium]
METGLLHLHSLLRWVILILLLIGVYQAFSRKEGIRSTSLWLLISAHTMLLIGLYQLIAGRFGIMKGLPESVTSLMKDSFYRFYWVEHPLLMVVAIILITLARGKAKALNYKNTGWLLLVALLFILVAIPWPFRAVGAGRALFPGM